MAYLILHVGPGKCGSTSIQEFFRKNKRAFKQKVVFSLLDPRDIARLNLENPNKSVSSKLSGFFNNNKEKYDAIILSHEYLFDCPLSIKNICDLGSTFFQKIIVIGYSRKQSDFIISVYSQWLFRHRERAKETQKILSDNEIEPLLFNGLEKHLISSILSEFNTARQPSNKKIMDWHESYGYLSGLIKESKTLLRCGLLPNKVYRKPLLDDFLEKADIKLKNYDHAKKDIVENVRFDQDVIEAINNALMLGMEIPHPDESNELINKISKKISNSENIKTLFFDKMKSYIDSHFWSSNKKFCEKFDLMQEYFLPKELISKNEIINIIKNEQKERFSKKLKIIEKNKKLSAKMVLACLKLSQENTKNSSTQINEFLKKIFEKF